MQKIITIDTPPAIDEHEVWRYLGRRGQALTPALEALCAEAVADIQSAMRPRAVLTRAPLVRSPELTLAGVPLPGAGIADLLEGSEEAVLMAVTLGIGADQVIRRAEAWDMTRAVILDACASAAVEAVCDVLSQTIAEDAAPLYTTERFSPGYSDLPLTLQPKILSALDAPRKIGLTCGESCLLFPRKSVTAVIGLRAEPRAPRGPRCLQCIMRGKCRYGICMY